MSSLPEVPTEVVKLWYKALHIDEFKIGREMLKTFDIAVGHRGQALSTKSHITSGRQGWWFHLQKGACGCVAVIWASNWSGFPWWTASQAASEQIMFLIRNQKQHLLSNEFPENLISIQCTPEWTNSSHSFHLKLNSCQKPFH